MTFYVNQGSDNNLIITFDYSPERVKKIRKVTNQWNPLEKCWEIPATEHSISRFLSVLQDEEVIFEPTLDFGTTGSIHVNINEMFWTKELIEKTDCALKLKGYSPLTIEAYIGHILKFFKFIKKQPDQVVNNDIEIYLINILEKKKVSFSYMNQAISAIKFVFKHVVRSNKIHDINVPRPKKVEKLPDILSTDEVIRIIKEVNNIKHRAILMLTYSAGLRVSEVVSLKVMDIDSKRMLIHVRQAKGRKDRYSILSKNTLDILRTYAKKFHPKEWLFPGDQIGKHLTERTAQKVFDTACKKADIKKDVSIHSLRHYVESQVMESVTRKCYY